MSLFDQNIIHYVDPTNDSPAYNRDFYSLPVVGHSCYVLISDNKTFIIRHIVDDPSVTEAEIVTSEGGLISFLVSLGAAGIEEVGVVPPVQDAESVCWDLIVD